MGPKEPTVNKESLNGSAPRPLTREERRQIERSTEEAMKQFNIFCNRFADYIYNTDGLTDEMVEERRKELDAKWRLYAKQHRLNESSITAFKDYCVKLYEAYKTELKGGDGAGVEAGNQQG